MCSSPSLVASFSVFLLLAGKWFGHFVFRFTADKDVYTVASQSDERLNCLGRMYFDYLYQEWAGCPLWCQISSFLFSFQGYLSVWNAFSSHLIQTSSNVQPTSLPCLYLIKAVVCLPTDNNDLEAESWCLFFTRAQGVVTHKYNELGKYGWLTPLGQSIKKYYFWGLLFSLFINKYFSSAAFLDVTFCSCRCYVHSSDFLYCWWIDVDGISFLFTLLSVSFGRCWIEVAKRCGTYLHL